MDRLECLWHVRLQVLAPPEPDIEDRDERPTLKGEHLEKQTDAVAGDACWEAYQGQVLALSFWEIDSTGLTTIVSHSCPRLKPGKRGGSKVHSYQIDTEKMRNNFQFSKCSESQCVICQEKRSSVATSTASSRKEGPKSYQKRKDFRLDSGFWILLSRYGSLVRFASRWSSAACFAPGLA